MEEKQTNEEHFLHSILTLYPFEVKKVKMISSRSGRTIWEVETDHGIKLLKQAHMDPRRMLFIAEAHSHLLEKGLPIANIHKTKKGGLCIAANGYSFVLYDKVEGKEMIYYDKEQLINIMEFIGKFHHFSKGYSPNDEAKKRSRIGKWHKLFRWKLQELEGNKQIALNYPNDPFSVLFLENVDKMLERGNEALQNLDNSSYKRWAEQMNTEGVFCQQDFTLARLIQVDQLAFMKELHSITYDLPTRDIRILLNKVMKKLALWDEDLCIELLRAYDSINPLSKEQYKILWDDIAFPYLFCSIAHKYYLAQKRSWSDQKYIWALQNIISVENSKEKFLKNFDEIYNIIKVRNGGEKID
ncbi:CotS family spore coat protein [Bacillus sp. JJ1533]|uniref:CotS family spore coat protein n=1 Tax=Bacillus sp. JJ1533 TaxID=3122959 RepID=UPI002FFED3C5